MPEVPKALMGGDQAFQRLAAILFGRNTAASQHALQRLEQLLGHGEILGIAGMVESHQNLVGQPAAMARRCTWAGSIGWFDVGLG